MDRSRLGVVIPAFNEAGSIGAVVAQVRPHGIPIVVDDGSTDQTGHIAAAEQAVVIRHETNRGYDEALNSGLEHASEIGCEFVVTMDADGQHNPSLLTDFVLAFSNGADVVIGTRDKYQRLAEWVFAWVAGVAWGIKDPLCGMKGYRMSIYNALGHFDSYGSIGTELAIFAARRGCNMAQFAVQTRERAGAPRFGRRFSANWRIFRALLLSLRVRHRRW